MASIAQLLALREQLQSSSDSPGVDVEYLLCHCLQKDRSFLRAWPDREVEPEAERHFLQLLERRAAGEPVAYLTGWCGFWTLELETTAATLIPRPDTELLVEETLRLAGDRSSASVLDLGTGTGAIALALASERPGWQLCACDISAEAVALAQRNRDRLGLAQVRIVQSDWYSALETEPTDNVRYDFILSNPPYIDSADPHLDQGDLRFEPRSALVSANAGFADIEAVITGARERLTPGGWLLFEHGYNQAQGARRRLCDAGFEDVYSARDLAGHERVSAGRWRGQDQL